MSEQVILVDRNDTEQGFMDKTLAHIQGRMHRAFSVLIFNKEGQFLMQCRANGKYHSAGLWTNTCCSHPSPGEPTTVAVHRRLQEEMGFDCELQFVNKFIYKAHVADDFFEHELDYIFAGEYNENPLPEKSEVQDWCWMTMEEIENAIEENPKIFTVWFKQIVKHGFLHDAGILVK